MALEEAHATENSLALSRYAPGIRKLTARSKPRWLRERVRDRKAGLPRRSRWSGTRSRFLLSAEMVLERRTDIPQAERERGRPTDPINCSQCTAVDSLR